LLSKTMTPVAVFQILIRKSVDRAPTVDRAVCGRQHEAVTGDPLMVPVPLYWAFAPSTTSHW
jgi:hypothetical protein